jgi:hypothetical protein
VGKPTPASVTAEDRAIIVEKNGWHAMTAAPVELGYPGYAVIFEISGHTYDTSKATKVRKDCCCGLILSETKLTGLELKQAQFPAY